MSVAWPKSPHEWGDRSCEESNNGYARRRRQVCLGPLAEAISAAPARVRGPKGRKALAQAFAALLAKRDPDQHRRMEQAVYGAVRYAWQVGSVSYEDFEFLTDFNHWGAAGVSWGTVPRFLTLHNENDTMSTTLTIRTTNFCGWTWSQGFACIWC